MNRQPRITKVSGFACDACGNHYPTEPPKWTTLAEQPSESPARIAYREQAREQASRCCTCPSCKQKSEYLVGTNDKRCAACRADSAWHHAVMQLSTALQAYELLAWPRDAASRRQPELERLLAAHVDIDNTMQRPLSIAPTKRSTKRRAT